MIRTTRRANRWGRRLIAAVAVPALLLAACNGDDVTDDDAPEADPDTDPDTDAEPDADPDEEAADGDRPEFLTLATGSTGGTYFPLGGAMAGVWSGEIEGLRVSTQASGASVENLRLLDAGEAELVMAVNGVAADAINGEGEFEGEEFDFAFLGNIYGEVMQVVASDPEIQSIADMAGRTIAIGPPGRTTPSPG